VVDRVQVGAFERAELVIVQEAYANTATVAYADLLLPAASWGEKSGTVTNSERRISRVRAAVPPPGQAREDWRIAVDAARRLETRLPARRADGGTLFPYTRPEDIWNEHRESTRGRDLDITGLSYTALDEPQFWPWPEGAAQPQARLYADARYATPDGRARFVAPAWRPTAEVRDARFPVSLNTGRLRDQWHGTSRTGALGRLFAHAPEPVLELHPQELARQRWKSGDLVRVKSRRGEVVLPVNASSAVLPAQAFIAMHWGPELMAGQGVNALTTGACCPQSRQPELKHAAVRLEAARLPWQVVAAGWLPAADAPAVRECLRALFTHFPYAVCVPFGRECAQGPGQVGLLFRAALDRPELPLLAGVEQAFALADGPVLRYADPRAGQRRALRLHKDGTLAAFLLAGDVAAQAWVLDLLQQGQPATAFGRALLAARPTPPAPVPPRSPQVCACHDVSEQAIVGALPLCTGAADERLQQLQRRLRCGTECGSCLPAVKSLLNQTPCEVIPA